jgi:cation diffusion facilitator family transporter
MVAEIITGWWFNSMALLADGWHMSTHAAAIGLSALAYAAARRYAADPRFAFGTWKIEVLAGFTSALFLLGIAVVMVVSSIERLADPQPIRFLEAIAVATLGLAVNLLCARILGPAHHHDHGHAHLGDRHHHDASRFDDHEHAHHHPTGDGHGLHAATAAGDRPPSPRSTPHHHHHSHPHGHVEASSGARQREDLNLRSAYLHVIADAATSALAIVALVGGMLLGWVWLDPVMGIVGAVMVSIWAWSLIRDTCRALLDCEMDHPLVAHLRHAIEAHAPWCATARTTRLHVWRVGRRRFACILGLATDDPELTVPAVKAWLRTQVDLAHIAVEVERAGPTTAPEAAVPAVARAGASASYA